jgi:DNA-binding transcriptional regulator YhcF (GntR family)
MDFIDPDDPRPPRRQLADLLRAAILTGKLGPGTRIPSGPELVEKYGVAKMTAAGAVDELKKEGLVVSRRGSGTFVREKPQRALGLRPHLERAFSAPQVTIDFAGFSGETLHNAISEPLDAIRDGRWRPDSIAIRMLVPDPDVPWALPSEAPDLKDSPPFRRRMRRIMERHTFGIVEEMAELERLGLIESATAEVRILPGSPLFKAYVINRDDVFFGFYPVTEHGLNFNGEDVVIFDLMGRDALLFHMDADRDDGDSMKSQFVTQVQLWFDSIWKIAPPIASEAD